MMMSYQLDSILLIHLRQVGSLLILIWSVCNILAAEMNTTLRGSHLSLEGMLSDDMSRCMNVNIWNNKSSFLEFDCGSIALPILAASSEWIAVGRWPWLATFYDHIFEDDNALTLDKEHKWFESEVKESIYVLREKSTFEQMRRLW